MLHEDWLLWLRLNAFEFRAGDFIPRTAAISTECYIFWKRHRPAVTASGGGERRAFSTCVPARLLINPCLHQDHLRRGGRAGCANSALRVTAAPRVVSAPAAWRAFVATRRIRSVVGRSRGLSSLHWKTSATRSFCRVPPTLALVFPEQGGWLSTGGNFFWTATDTCSLSLAGAAVRRESTWQSSFYLSADMMVALNVLQILLLTQGSISNNATGLATVHLSLQIDGPRWYRGYTCRVQHWHFIVTIPAIEAVRAFSYNALCPEFPLWLSSLSEHNIHLKNQLAADISSLFQEAWHFPSKDWPCGSHSATAEHNPCFLYPPSYDGIQQTGEHSIKPPSMVFSSIAALFLFCQFIGILPQMFLRPAL